MITCSVKYLIVRLTACRGYDKEMLIWGFMNINVHLIVYRPDRINTPKISNTSQMLLILI